MKIIAEIGINHNGDLGIAKKLIAMAKGCGVDIVKFQKRTPDLCVPDKMKETMRYGTPWGDITYLNYRRKVEFGKKEYDAVDKYCKQLGIDWMASAWDIEAQKFINQYHLKYNKISSPMVTNLELLELVAGQLKHTFISTGMSSLEEIDKAVECFRRKECPFELMHCNSTYPMRPEDANLKCIPMLRERYQCDVGYSGHETGLEVSLAAAVFNISSIERHITLDRALWGTDQAASLEKRGLELLVTGIKTVTLALGDGEKRVCPGEVEKRKQLRGC